MTKVSASESRKTGRELPRRQRLILAVIACVALTLMTGFYYKSCGEYPDGPAEALDGDGAVASGPCGRKRKDNLKNIFHYYVLETPIGNYEIFNMKVYTDWGYIPDRFPCSQPGLIRWRNSDPVFTPVASVGTVWLVGKNWYTSQCYDSGRQCLTRLDSQAGWSVNIKGIDINGYQSSCIGTRIGPGGNHNRAAYDKRCDQVARAARARDPLAAQRAYRNWDRTNATIEDYVGRRTSDRIHRYCSGGLGSSQCRKTLWRAYKSLSPTMQRRAAKAMTATVKEHR